MPSITDIVLSDITNISDAYVRNIAEPSHKLQKISEEIRESGKYIVPFESKPLDSNTSLVAIDGGNASEKLSGGDLIVAGATLGEGIKSKKIFTGSEEVPSEVFSTILPHKSYNDKIEKSMRALLELRILAAVNADVKIIDGAYLGNISQILYALIDQESSVSDAVLEHNFFDSDGLLNKALTEILYPPRPRGNNIIAVPKSDSSMYYVNNILDKFNLKDLGLSDRLLAARILKPGEMLVPRQIQSNPGLESSLTKSIGMEGFASKSIDKPSLMKLVSDKAGLLRRLGLSDHTEEGLLWTTYFKPHAWHEHSSVIKIEFLHYHNDRGVMPILEKAKDSVQKIDADIIDSNILEPWSQYQADLGAKQVSVAINILKNHLITNAQTGAEAMSIVRGYRT